MAVFSTLNTEQSGFLVQRLCDCLQSIRAESSSFQPVIVPQECGLLRVELHN